MVSLLSLLLATLIDLPHCIVTRTFPYPLIVARSLRTSTLFPKVMWTVALRQHRRRPAPIAGAPLVRVAAVGVFPHSLSTSSSSTQRSWRESDGWDVWVEPTRASLCFSPVFFVFCIRSTQGWIRSRFQCVRRLVLVLSSPAVRSGNSDSCGGPRMGTRRHVDCSVTVIQ